MSPGDRSVRIFLSSTFRDFGEERDLLVRRVFSSQPARLKAASARWKLRDKKEYTGDVADAPATFLRCAGTGLTGTFVPKLAQQALEIEERIQGSDHPVTGPRLDNLAMLLEARGDYAAAEPLYRRA